MCMTKLVLSKTKIYTSLKCNANGRADRNDSFLVYDITGLVDPNAVTPPAGE